MLHKKKTKKAETDTQDRCVMKISKQIFGSKVITEDIAKTQIAKNNNDEILIEDRIEVIGGKEEENNPYRHVEKWKELMIKKYEKQRVQRAEKVARSIIRPHVDKIHNTLKNRLRERNFRKIQRKAQEDNDKDTHKREKNYWQGVKSWEKSAISFKTIKLLESNWFH